MLCFSTISPHPHLLCGREGSGIAWQRRWLDRCLIMILRPFAGSLLQISDERLFEIAGTSGSDQLRRRILRQYPAGMHERNAIATLSLVHEMSRYKNGHAIVSGELDQQLPELIAGHGIDP